MARFWISRKLAAQARLRNRRGITPESEVRAAQVQFKNDQSEERMMLDKAEKLKAEMKPEKKVKVKENTLVAKAKKKSAMKPKPKVVKAKVEKKVDPKFGEHGHDFNSQED